MRLLAADGARSFGPICDLLFVYGTLRRGFSHHRILKRLRARPVGQGSVQAELYDLGAFPGARPAAPDFSVGSPVDAVAPGPRAQGRPVPRVVGELYRLQNPERDLQVLDDYEGFRPSDPGRSFFRRELAEVLPCGRPAKPAWVYWLNRRVAPGRLIVEGDYALR